MRNPTGFLDNARRALALLAALSCLAQGMALAAVGGKLATAEVVSAPAELGVRDPSFPSTAISGQRLPAMSTMMRSKAAVAADTQFKRLQIGSARNLAAEAVEQAGPAQLQWVAAPGGGSTTRLSIQSPQAAALRAGLSVQQLPDGAELRFLGARSVAGSVTPLRAVGLSTAAQARAAQLAQGLYWTPLTEGDTQVVEIWLPPAANSALVRVAIQSVSHVDVSPSQVFKNSTGVGAAQSCNQDVACAPSANEALARAARSVTKMVFTENGVTYLCTGTLVSDGDAQSEIPYVYTAAHCMQSQAAAATLNTFWFFDSSTCGGSANVAYKQLSSGATLLYSNPSSDAALVRLAERAPAGAWFSGWDATPLAAGTSLVAIHHPAGDVKKMTVGQSLAATTSATGSYSTAAWTVGSTEGGSSGSGVFTLAGGEYVLRGGLRGGSASCGSAGNLTDPSNRDYYSRIDQEAATLKTWLAAAAAPLEDFTGMWANPAEPGSGLSIVQGLSNRVFITLFTYDATGKPVWVVLPEGTWRTTSSFEAAAYRTTGTPLGEAYDAARSSLAPVGSARIDFAHGDTATLTLTLDGRVTVKSLRRLPS